MKEKFERACFSIDKIRSDIVTKCLVEDREIRLIVDAPSY